jgi:hypothetical protein
MELWIRSQDGKDLVKVNSLWIMDNQIWMEVPFYENHKKLGLTVSGHNHKLAEYKTKERALEVLDEIQSKLTPNFKINGSYQEMDLTVKAYLLNTQYGVIYKMPKE